ncbi:hypothetical protein [Kistimonas asteriae]|uniref:hypothetical protein n=1 Tax=Kistimonas asteriae TaxID=517724 RepID=UPI001BAD6C3A|nr:hypothetical protein [Kistimonas asteriae]
MTSPIHGSQGAGGLPFGGVSHEGDSVVTHQHRTIKVTDPVLKAKLIAMADMQDQPSPNVSQKSHDDRVITATDTTYSLKAESDSTRRASAGEDRDIAPDEGLIEGFNSDTQSVPGDFEDDTASVIDHRELDTASVFAEMDIDDDDVDIEGVSTELESIEDGEEVTEHVSLKERLANASANVSQKAKTLGKSIKDWVISLPNRVMNKMPRKVADAFVLHAPSPKALKARVIGKIANPSSHIQDLKRESSERLHNLSKPGGPSAHADDDQLAAVEKNIENTETELQTCKQELEDLLEHFDSEDALQRRDELNQRISTLTSDLKSYQLAEKMLLKMIKPVADKVQKDLQAEERTDYDAKADTFKQQSKVLDTELALLEKDYADLKSSLKKKIQTLKKDIEAKEAEIKTLQNKMEKIDSEEEEVENPFVYLGGVAVHYDEAERMLEDKKDSLQVQRDQLDNIQRNISAKKKEVQDVKGEQATLRKEMRKDKSAFERSVNSLKGGG